MAMQTVGYAALQIVPSVKDIKQGIGKSVTEPMKSEGTKAGKGFGNAFNKGVLGVVAVGAAALGGLYKAGEAFTDVTDTIIVGTGASGAALAGLQSVAKSVATRVPASLGDIGVAVADLNTRMDLTGPELDTMAGKFLNLSRITKSDVSSNIANVSRVFGDWGISTEGQSLALDKMFEATKRTGIGLDRLTTLTVQYGAPLRQMGFSFEETLSLFGKFEKEGVNTETVFAGLRMGLSKMAVAGEEPVSTFKRVVKSIEDAGSAGEANKIALEAFGSRAGPDMAAAIREGRLELDDMVAGLMDSEGALDSASSRTEHFSEALQVFKNKALVKIEPVATKVFNVLTKGMEWLGDVGMPIVFGLVEQFRPLVSDLFVKLAPLAQKAFDRLKPLAVDALAKVREAVAWLAENGVPMLESFAGWLSRNADWIKRVAIVAGGLFAAFKVGQGVLLAYRGAVAAVNAVQAVLNSTFVKTVARYAALAIAKAKDLAQTAAIAAMYAGDAVRAAAQQAAALARVAAGYVAAGAAKAKDLVVLAAHTAAMVAQRVAMLAVRGAMMVATAAQWAWNAAMSANPIGLIIAAVLALVAAIVWLWNNNEGFRNFVIAAWEAIKSAVMVVVDWFQTYVLPVLQQVWEGILVAVRTVVDWFQTYVQPVIQAVFDAVVGYVKFVFNVYKTVWNAIRAAIDAVVSWLRDTAWPAIRNVWQSFIDKVRAVWDAVSSAFTSVVDFVKGIPGKVKSALINAATVLVSRGREFITGLWDGLKEKWTSAMDWVKGLVDKVKNVFSQAKEWLKDAGRNIITGLWNGLKEKWESVKSWVSGIGDWIGEHKGPKAYDLALLRPNGGWIMTGLKRGLEDGIPALQSTLGRITDTLGLDATMSTALAGGSAGAGSSRTFNYYAAPGARQLSGADELERSMSSARGVGW